MPTLAPMWLVAVAGEAGAAAIMTAVAKVAISVALSVAATKYQQNQLKQNLKQGPREVIVRDTTQPQVVVYGEAFVGGVICYMNTVHPGVNQGHELHMAILVAGHEIEDVTDIYLDDTLLRGGTELDWTTTNAVVSGIYDPDSRTDCEAVKVWKHLGTSTQTVDTELNANYTADWTSDYRLRGLAYLVFRFKLTEKSESLWAGGPPQSIRIKVKGKKCYDPRTGTTVWTSNPVLCAADYMTSFMGVASARMDWDWIGAQATVCDTLVDIPGPSTEKRYTCNGSLSLGETHKKNIEAILSSCMGRLSKVGGKWRITAGAYEFPSVSLSDADVVGPIVMSTSLQRSERFNTVRGVFGADPNNKYREMEFRQVTSATYVARDNGETIARSLSLPMTNSEYMAQRIAFKTLRQGDQQTTVTFPVRWTGLRVAVGSSVNVTIARFGWSGKVFRCIGWKMGGGEAPFELVLREDSAAAWNDPAIAEYTTVTATGAVTLPSEDTPKDNPQPAPQNVIPFGLGEFEITTLTELSAMASTTLEIDTSQAYLGTKSLKVTGPTTNGATWGLYLTATVASTIVDNTHIAPGRRWIVVCSIRPGSADSVGNDVDYKIGFRNGTNAATLSGANNSMAASTWNRVAFEIDMTGNAYITGKLVIQATNDSLRSTAPYFWIDAIAMVDVTNNPNITEENFFGEHIPSSGTGNVGLYTFRVKTADETRTSTETLTADNHLNGWVLEAGKAYSLEAMFLYKGNSSGDFQWRFVCSQTPQVFQGIRIYHGQNVGGVEGVVDYQILTSETGDQTDGTTDAAAVHQRLSAILIANASNNGTMELQWAQSASNGTATTLMKGSWVNVVKMN